MKFTTIEPHPLQHGKFMLWCKATPSIAPFFGTKKKCEEKQPIWEMNLKLQFEELDKDRQQEIINQLQNK